MHKKVGARIFGFIGWARKKEISIRHLLQIVGEKVSCKKNFFIRGRSGEDVSDDFAPLAY